MTTVLILAFLGGWIVGSGSLYAAREAYRSWVEANHFEVYKVSPSSGTISRDWIPRTQGRRIEVPDPEDSDGEGYVALDASYAFEGETGLAWVVDTDRMALLDITEYLDYPQLYPADGRLFAEVAEAELFKDLAHHTSSEIDRLPEMIRNGFIGGGLLLLAVIALLVQGFGMIG